MHPFFSQNVGLFFKIFKILENGPIFRDIFVKDGTHVYGFFMKKLPIRAAHPCMS